MNRISSKRMKSLTAEQRDTYEAYKLAAGEIQQAENKIRFFKDELTHIRRRCKHDGPTKFWDSSPECWTECLLCGGNAKD
jgi:hypothetical protein